MQAALFLLQKYMKILKLRIANRVDITRLFSASIRGGARGYKDALALETHSNDVAPTIKTVDGFTVICFYEDFGKKEQNMAKEFNDKLPEELRGKKFRIRKLTPRECFRLMGVDDNDIDKIQAAGISDSAQYKLAGNSIVVDVLYHIFRKMFIEPENETQQLTLF